MADLLTHSEHAARAMLLGLVYDWRDGTYCRLDNGKMTSAGMLDCVTMQPIGDETADKRMRRYGMDFLKASSNPVRPVPWAVTSEVTESS